MRGCANREVMGRRSVMYPKESSSVLWVVGGNGNRIKGSSATVGLQNRSKIDINVINVILCIQRIVGQMTDKAHQNIV